MTLTTTIVPAHIRAGEYGLTIDQVRTIYATQAAVDIRAIWDYRALGFTADRARTIIRDIVITASHHARREPRRVPGAKSTPPDGNINYYLFSRYRRQREERLRALLPETWCQEIQVTATDSASCRYTREVKWPAHKYGQKCWPSRRYDILRITFNPREPVGYETTSKSLTMGRWQWRKGKGHALSVRYIGDADHALSDWQRTTNQELRRAILARHGENMVQALNPILVQADDFGRLYDISTGSGFVSYDRYLRVVCPTTGAIYWLHTDRKYTTAHAAVAASFGLEITMYSPDIQV